MKNNKMKLFLPLAMLFALFIYNAVAQQGKRKGQQNGKSEQMDKQKGNKNKAEKQKGMSANMREDKKENGGSQFDNGKKGNNGNKKKFNVDAVKNNASINGQGSTKKYKLGSYNDYDYGWNDKSYKNRKDKRNKVKVSLCHKPANGKGGVSITVSQNALKAHLNHGDYEGNCNNSDNGIFSDIFNRNRTEYYNTVENSREQLFYSQSVLDYAIQKLSSTQYLLETQKQNGLSAAEYSIRQAAVNKLEDRVSLLQTTVNVATALLINSL